MTGDGRAGDEPCGRQSASGTTRRKCLAHGQVRQTWSTDGLDRGDYREVWSRPGEVLCGGHRGQPIRIRRNDQIHLCNGQLSGRHPRPVGRFTNHICGVLKPFISESIHLSRFTRRPGHSSLFRITSTFA